MGKNCFSGGEGLATITIEGDCDRIREDVFLGRDKVVIWVPVGSHPENYAKEKGLQFRVI